MPAAKLTPDFSKKFFALIREGVTQERAAWSLNVDEKTVWMWRKRGEVEPAGKYHDFAVAYRKAKGENEIDAIRLINEAATKDWKAKGWLLERLNPDVFGLKVKVTHEARDKLAVDLLRRLSGRLDASVYAEVQSAILASCLEANESDDVPEGGDGET